MRPIQTGWAEMPMRTKTIAPLSMTERGFTADSTPIGIETSSQRTAPPKHERGGDRRRRQHDVVHIPLVDERPPEGGVEDEILEPDRVLLPDGLVEVQVLGDLLNLLGCRGLPRGELRRVVRGDEEDDVA